MRFILPICVLFFVSLLSCNVTDKGSNTVVVKGQVVNLSEENAPISGLNIALKMAVGSGWQSSYPVVATTRTNSNGAFSIEYELESGQNNALVYVNSEPYNPNYSTYIFDARKGEKVDKQIEIYSNATLTVIAQTDELQEGDRYCIYVPGRGICESDNTSASVTTTRAFGNMENEITFSLRSDGETQQTVYSVFVPVGEETQFEIEF